MLLIKPQILSVKNWWKNRPLSAARIFQDVFIIFLLAALCYLVFYASSFTLSKVKEFSYIVYLSAEQILSIILFFLFLMSFFSHLALSIGAFFFSADNDLLQASPISDATRYNSKSFLVFVAAAWMPLFFLSPFLAAFFIAFQTPLLHMCVVGLLLVIFFYLTNALAQCFAFLLIHLAFLRNKKVLFLLLLCLITFVLYHVSSLLLAVSEENSALQAFLRIFETLSFCQMHWLPSHWVSHIIGELIEFHRFADIHYSNVFLAATAFFSISAYLLWKISNNKREVLRQVSSIPENKFKNFSKRLLLINMWKQKNMPLLISKDLLLLSRDMAQLIQVLMLAFLCFLYVSHVHVLEALNFFPEDRIIYWRNILVLSNILLATFLCTAICTRLVYPSLSLEGRVFWLIQTAPLKLTDVLKSKFVFWYVPLACTLCLFFVIGSLMLGVSTSLLIAHIFMAIIIAYSLVALALGLGAAYARFDWEHSSQMAMSFGSCIFMLVSVSLVAVTVSFLVIARYVAFRIDEEWVQLLFMAASYLVVAMLHIRFAHAAMQRGAAVLLKRYAT